MLAVLRSMELNSLLLSVRSAIEEQWEVLHSCRKSKELSFNRALFDRDMVTTSNADGILAVSHKHVNNGEWLCLGENNPTTVGTRHCR